MRVAAKAWSIYQCGEFQALHQLQRGVKAAGMCHNNYEYQFGKGSWSGPPSGSSSHHLLAIEEEDRPTGSQSKIPSISKPLAQLATSERRWASLDNNLPPSIQVTQADKEEPSHQPPPLSQQQQGTSLVTGDSASLSTHNQPMSYDPNYTPMTTAGLSTMLRIKQKLARKRSGSLPEERLGIAEMDTSRLVPPGHVSADATVSQTPAATSPISPVGRTNRFARGRSTGSLPGPGTLSPRLLSGGHSPTLALSPIASPASSPLPTPCDPRSVVEGFGLAAAGAAKAIRKPAPERRQTVADIGGKQAKTISPALTPPSASSLLDLYLDPSQKFARLKQLESKGVEHGRQQAIISNVDYSISDAARRSFYVFLDPPDEHDDVILDLSYKYSDKKRPQYRAIARSDQTIDSKSVYESGDPAVADLIHFSSPSPEGDSGKDELTEKHWLDDDTTETIANTYNDEATAFAAREYSSVEYKEVFKKIAGRRPLAPCIAAMASKLRNSVGRRRGWPKRGETLPEMPEADSSEERLEESWMRKSSAPLPPPGGFKRLLQHQRPCASQEVSKDDYEQAATVRRLSQSRRLSQIAPGRGEEMIGGPRRKESGRIFAPYVTPAQTRQAVDTQTSISSQHRLQPFLLHCGQQSITSPPLAPRLLLEQSDMNWINAPSMHLAPEMPDRSESSVSDSARPVAKKNVERNRNLSISDTGVDRDQSKFNVNWNFENELEMEHIMLATAKPKELILSEAEISISLHYSQSIGFLVVTVNTTKNMPYVLEAFVKIMRFESNCLVEWSQTSTVSGKSGPEFKQAYMYGMEESTLLITHLVIELWECDAIGEQRRFGYAVIGPHAGGSGCLQWTRVCKHPNFPSCVWHQLALAEN